MSEKAPSTYSPEQPVDERRAVIEDDGLNDWEKIYALKELGTEAARSAIESPVSAESPADALELRRHEVIERKDSAEKRKSERGQMKAHLRAAAEAKAAHDTNTNELAEAA